MQVTQRTMDQNGDILGPLTALPHSDNTILLYQNGKIVKLLQNDGRCHSCMSTQSLPLTFIKAVSLESDIAVSVLRAQAQRVARS